jgi:hypothetical protein
MILLTASLAVGLGFGLSACASFVSLSLFGVSHGPLVSDVALLLLVGMTGLWMLTQRDVPAATSTPAIPPPGRTFRWLLGGSLAVCSVVALLTFLLRSLESSHGNWDAWAIWNLRARFIFRSGSDWREAFSSPLHWSHPDYPLLLPLSVARVWRYLGRESQAAPIAIAMLFTFSIVTLAGASLAFLRGWSQATLAILLLLGTSSLVNHGTSQLADVPLGFFMLATVTGLILKERLPERATFFLAMTGMMAGLATWTKNEGWLVLVSVVVARAAVLGYIRGWVAWSRELPHFVFGLAPVLLTVLWFKLALAPPNGLVSNQGWVETSSRLIDPVRYVQIYRGFKNAVIALGDGAVINPLLVLLFYLVCVGIEPDERDKTGVATGLGAVGLIVIGFSLVYLTSPADLDWHLRNSAWRLLLQLWPSVVFLGFSMACPPERSKG